MRRKPVMRNQTNVKTKKTKKRNKTWPQLLITVNVLIELWDRFFFLKMILEAGTEGQTWLVSH